MPILISDEWHPQHGLLLKSDWLELEGHLPYSISYADDSVLERARTNSPDVANNPALDGQNGDLGGTVVWDDAVRFDGDDIPVTMCRGVSSEYFDGMRLSPERKADMQKAFWHTCRVGLNTRERMFHPDNNKWTCLEYEPPNVGALTHGND